MTNELEWRVPNAHNALDRTSMHYAHRPDADLPCRHLNHVGKVAVVPHEAQHAFVRVARQLLRS